MERETDFYVHLSSDTKSDYRNRHNLFRIKLAVPLNLKTGHLKVALTQISYPFDWNNIEISGARMSIIHKKEHGTKNFELITRDPFLAINFPIFGDSIFQFLAIFWR